MEIRVVLEPLLDQYSVDDMRIILQEQNGARKIAIKIDESSLVNLATVLGNVDLRAPLVQAVFFHCVQALQGDIVKIVVHDIINGFFRTKIFIRDQRIDNVYSLDINVIDGVTIASICQCPIFIEEEVFNKYSENVKRFKEESIEKFFDNVDWNNALSDTKKPR